MREWTVNIMNKIRIISVLLSICILLTACSATGASSVASSAPASSESASNAPAAARPMDYDTYFSASRPIESHAGRYISGDTLTLRAENGEYLMPFPAAPGKYAETEKGVLILRDYDGIYLLNQPGETAELIYKPQTAHNAVYLSEKADENVMFVVEDGRGTYDSRFQICRIYRPTGQVDVLATDEDVSGKFARLEVVSNTIVRVISTVPWAVDPAAEHVLYVDTRNGIRISDEDPGYKDLMTQIKQNPETKMPEESRADMTREEYFSQERQIKRTDSYFDVGPDGELTYNSKKVFPFPVQWYVRVENLFTQSPVGAFYVDRGSNTLWLFDKDYENDPRWSYTPLYPYCVTQISDRADECLVFTIEENRYDPNDIRICRVSHANWQDGSYEVLATSQDIPGKINKIYTKSNYVTIVESYLPYNTSIDWTDDWTTEDAYNARIAARRYTIINAADHTIVSSDDEAAFAQAVQKLPGYWS